MAEGSGLTAEDILRALEARHPRPMWATFRELRVGTGIGTDVRPQVVNTRDGQRTVWHGSRWEHRIDLWCLCLYPSRRLERVAYEVKVSRSDLARELADPGKREVGLELSNRFYFAAPAGLLSSYDLPENCGLVKVSSDGETRMVHRPPWRDTAEPTWRFVASVARRVAEVPRRCEELERENRLLLAVLYAAQGLRRETPDAHVHTETDLDRARWRLWDALDAARGVR